MSSETQDAVRDPRFRVQRELGRGASSVVHLVEEVATGRLLALKVLAGAPDAEQVARFDTEAALLSRLTHPAIVELALYGTLASGALFLAMPYLADASTLAEWIARMRPGLAPPALRAATLTLIGDIAAALDHVHAHGVLHRDLKPGNVLVTAAGRAVVLDFGLARVDHQNLTRTGIIVGTPTYLSPEQVRGDRLTPASDLYQLGMLAHEILSGTRAVADADVYLERLSRGVLPFPPLRTHRPELGPGLEDVVLRAVAVDPAERFASGAALVAALGALPPASWGDAAPAARPSRNAPALARKPSRASGETPAPAQPGAARPGRTRRERTLTQRVKPALALLVVALMAALAWAARRPSEPLRPPRIVLGHDRALLIASAERLTTFSLRSAGRTEQATPGLEARFILGPFNADPIDFELEGGPTPIAGRIDPPPPIRLRNLQLRGVAGGLELELAASAPVGGTIHVRRPLHATTLQLPDPRTEHRVLIADWPARGNVSLALALTDALGRPLPTQERVLRADVP